MKTEQESTVSWLSSVNGEEPSEEVLLKIYDTHENDRNAALDLHYSNRNYYMTLVSALLAIFAGGMLQFYREISSFILLAIPITVLALSELAKKSMDRYYQRFLEATVILAKIEHLFGLDGPIRSKKLKSTKILWSKDKHFVLERWATDRAKCNSSEQFISERMSMGDNRYAHWVFSLMEVVTIILSLVSLVILLRTHVN